MVKAAAIKRLFFIAGDVGGARALLPVILECEERNLPFWVATNGHLPREAPQRWPMIDLPANRNPHGIANFLTDLGVGVLTFGSSVHDTLPLAIARQAKRQGIPVVHILDNWTGYRRRLEHDGLPMLLPDIYTLMDEVAYEGATAEGIDPAVLSVTGHPALASLHWEISAEQEKKQRANPYRHLLFVSEPVTADQGDDTDSPAFRGYTETQVLRLLCEALQPHADEARLSILPHPREKREHLNRTFEQVKGRLQGSVLTNGKGRRQVLNSDGVVGMASLLLYEAWLAGKPVLSLQPDLRREDLRMLARREGVCFVDTPEKVKVAVAEWIIFMRKQKNRIPPPDLARHQQAAKRISLLLEERLPAV